MELLGLVIGLIVLGLLASRFGRDGRTPWPTDGTIPAASLAADTELAAELDTARRRRNMSTDPSVLTVMPEAQSSMDPPVAA